MKEISKEFVPIEAASNQFDERFLELKCLLYDNKMDIFNQIQNDFLAKKTSCLTWTDGDQKNFAINRNGDLIVFDFGRAINNIKNCVHIIILGSLRREQLLQILQILSSYQMHHREIQN